MDHLQREQPKENLLIVNLGDNNERWLEKWRPCREYVLRPPAPFSVLQVLCEGPCPAASSGAALSAMPNFPPNIFLFFLFGCL